MRILPALALMTGLVACGSTGPVPVSGDCVALFQQYDVVEATMSPSGRRYDSMAIPPQLQGPAARIRQARCITFSDSLRFDVPPTVVVAESGPTFPRPVRVHAGAVTSMDDDAAAQAFFTARGVAATSIGSAALGRRIYLGPFATRGGLDSAMALARAAGFAYPYPARF